MDDQTIRSAKLVELANLIREHNAVTARISQLVGRPDQVGDVGEYIAAAIFDIELNPSASAKGHDGLFRPPSPLVGRSVNVKWGTPFEGGMDVSPDAPVDDHLALVSPRHFNDVQRCLLPVANRSRLPLRRDRASYDPPRRRCGGRSRDCVTTTPGSWSPKRRNDSASARPSASPFKRRTFARWRLRWKQNSMARDRGTCHWRV